MNAACESANLTSYLVGQFTGRTEYLRLFPEPRDVDLLQQPKAKGSGFTTPRLRMAHHISPGKDVRQAFRLNWGP